MRILAIAPWVPSSRRPRSFGLLKILSREHDVRLICATWNKSDTDDASQLEYPTRSVSMTRLHAILRAAFAVFSRSPLQQRYLDAPEMREAIAAEMKDFEPELVIFNTLRSAQWREIIEGCVLAIDLDEFRSGYYEQVSRSSSNPLWRLVARTEAKRMRRAERTVLDTFSSVIVSSPLDVSNNEDNLHLVRSPHALTSGARQESDKTEEPHLVFVGRMSYRANVEAIVWFAQNVLPALKSRFPSVVLDIVGDSPARAVSQLAGTGINVLGRVDSVDAYYTRAWISIVPVTMATGVQMKLIESLHIGVPTVTSLLVAKQAGVENGRHVLTAETPEEWVTAVSELLGDQNLAAELSSNGRQWAEEHYGDGAVEKALKNALANGAGR